MFILLNLVEGVRGFFAHARRTHKIHDPPPIQPTPPAIYKFDDVLATGNKVCQIIQSYRSDGLDLEVLYRTIHTKKQLQIIRKDDSSRNKTITHTPSGHSITINCSSQIIDYSPQSPLKQVK